MNIETLKKYLPRTARYIDNTIKDVSTERADYHLDIVQGIILNSKIDLEKNKNNDNECLDAFIEGYLLGCDRLTMK